MSDTEHTIVYIIVEAYSSKKLQQQVNKYIMEGYRPHGSISIIYMPDNVEAFNYLYTQPMLLKRY